MTRRTFGKVIGLLLTSGSLSALNINMDDQTGTFVSEPKKIYKHNEGHVYTIKWSFTHKGKETFHGIGITKKHRNDEVAFRELERSYKEISELQIKQAKGLKC